MSHYYPIMLDIRDRHALVIGGNMVAAEKAAALAASGARVTIQAAEFGMEVRDLAGQGRVTLLQKAYVPGDLAGAFVVVAAVTYDPDLVEAIWAEGRRRGQLVNIVDVPAKCAFIVPSILRRGQLTIAVSTEGSNPSLAKRIRQRLETMFPPAYDAFLRLAKTARTHLRAANVSYDRRDAFFGEYYASAALAQMEAGDMAGAAATTAALLQRYAVTVPSEQLREAVQANADA